MFVHTPLPRTIPWAAIVITLLLSIDLASTVWRNLQERNHTLTQLSQVESQAVRAITLPLLGHTPAPPVSDPVTLELEALGVKLRMINEATWTAIIKLAVLWLFLLASLIVYRLALKRLSLG